MSTQPTMPDRTAHAVAVLEEVRRTYPVARLFAGHRAAIRVALAQAGFTSDDVIVQRVEHILAPAQGYEESGMFAVVPTWADLFRRLRHAEATAAEVRES